MRSQQEKYAKLYIRNGWSILPVRTGTKEPLLPWKNFTEQKSTFETVKTWFDKWPDCGIGIVTGKVSNLTIVDCDSLEAYNNLKQKGINSNVIVKTPKGYHLYFKYSEQAKTSVSILPNVDIRNQSGFACSPPTIGYSFNNPYFVLNSIPKFPLHLIPTPKENSRNAEGWIADALKGLQPGNRDISFTKIIGRLNRDGYTANDIILLLSPYAETSGFGIDSLNEKVEHILNDYPHNKSLAQDDSDSLQDFLRDIKPIRWICQPIIAQGTLGFIAGLPETLKTWLMADLAIEVAKGGCWLGKFPVKQGRVLFIDQERYKGEVQRRFKSLMSEKGLTIKDLEGKLILKSQTTTRIDLEESFNAFRKRLNDIRPSLVIVDSFATFHTKNENDRRDIQTVLERLKQLRTEFGCTILMIDHENKGVFSEEEASHNPNAFKMVGSVGKPAAAETVFVVRKLSENEVILYHVKSTIAPTIEPVKLKISDTEKGILIQ